MRKALPIVFFALAAGLAASPARAASEPPPPPPKVDPAKAAADRLAELIKRGTEKCTEGDVDDGLPALRAAWTQHQDADLAVVLGSCEIKASDWPSAAEHLAFALRNKDNAEQRKALEATFLNVRARVGAVKVTVTIDGADVFAGDRFAGQSPLPGEVYVAPGKSRISAKKTGYGEIEGPVEVQPGGTVALKLDLAGEGTIAGAQRVTATRSRTPGLVIGAIGAVALGVGAAFYAAALSKSAAADDVLTALATDYPAQGSSPCYGTSHAACDTIKNLRASHDTYANAGTGFLAGGGALVGAGVVYGLWATFSTPEPARPPVTFGAAPTRGGGGVWLQATF